MPLPDKPGGPVVDMFTRSTYIEPEKEPETPGTPETSGKDGNGPMEPTVPVQSYIDRSVEAVESRLLQKLDRIPTKGTLWAVTAALIGGLFTAIALVFGFVAFGGDRFDGGMTVSPIVAAVQKDQAAVDKKQDAQLGVMDSKLDILIERSAK